MNEIEKKIGRYYFNGFGWVKKYLTYEKSIYDEDTIDLLNDCLDLIEKKEREAEEETARDILLMINTFVGDTRTKDFLVKELGKVYLKEQNASS